MGELAPELNMESAEEDILRQIQVRASLDTILEKVRLEIVEQYVREQFEDDLRALTEAEQDSKELKSAKRGLLVRPDHRVGRAAVPGRAGDGRRRGPGRQGLADEAVRQEGVRGDLQAPRPPEDRHRQAASRRTSRRGRPRRHLRGPRGTTRARLGPLHPRPDADHVAAHARNGEGGAANRRPLARDRPPVHAPLQLPALLGGRDRLHARAEAPRHRSRCARPAGARADDPAGGGLPVHDPHRLGDARVERLLVDGIGLRLDACAHGRRSADQGARSAASPWASSRKATST